MSDRGYVYTLVDPRTQNPRYVGATENPRTRLSSHLSNPPNQKMQFWIGELNELGLTPNMNLIRVVDSNELQETESKLISSMSDEYNLLNVRTDTQDSWNENEGSTMVKADVPENVHTELRLEAARRNEPIENVVREILIEQGKHNE